MTVEGKIITKRLAPIALASVVILMLPGCPFSGGAISASELVQRAQSNVDDAQTCKMEGTMSMDMSAGTDGMEGFPSMSMNMEMTGKIDFENQSMELLEDVDMTMEMFGSFSMTTLLQCYLKDGWMYIGVGTPDSESTFWQKTQISEMDTFWQGAGLVQSDVDSIVEILGSATEVTIEGTEKVKGVDCYYVEVELDPTALWEVLMGSMTEEDYAELGLIEDELDDVITSWTVKMWYAKDTCLPMKVLMNMALEVDGGTIDVSFETVMYDYNEPVSIDVPQEGLNAEEVEIDWDTFEGWDFS